MNIWNYWPKHYRNTRAMGAAVAMFMAIIAMSLLRCNPMVGRESTPGLVLTIEAEGLAPFDNGMVMSRVVVAVADSTEIRLFLPPPVPRVGDFIPLTAEHYKKGNIIYFLDRERWLIDGPRQSRP